MDALLKHSKLRISDSGKERNNLGPFHQKLVRAGHREGMDIYKYNTTKQTRYHYVV